MRRREDLIPQPIGQIHFRYLMSMQKYVIVYSFFPFFLLSFLPVKPQLPSSFPSKIFSFEEEIDGVHLPALSPPPLPLAQSSEFGRSPTALLEGEGIEGWTPMSLFLFSHTNMLKEASSRRPAWTSLRAPPPAARSLEVAQTLVNLSEGEVASENPSRSSYIVLLTFLF